MMHSLKVMIGSSEAGGISCDWLKEMSTHHSSQHFVSSIQELSTSCSECSSLENKEEQESCGFLKHSSLRSREGAVPTQ